MEEGEKKGPVLFFVVEEPKTLLLPLHVVEAAKNIPSPFFLRLSPHPDPPQLVGRAWREEPKIFPPPSMGEGRVGVNGAS
jgi:hypothetical protein